MRAYKITDSDGCCMGIKYSVGGVYSYEGEIVICKSGYHASKRPMDCQKYHDIYDARFFEVDCRGEIIEEYDKLCCSEIEVIRELTLREWIDLCFESIYILPSIGNDSSLASSVDRSQLASSGYDSILASSGNYSQLSSSGRNSQLSSSGAGSKLSSSGKNTICAAVGKISRVMVKSEDSWMVIADYDDDGSVRRGIFVKPGDIVDGIIIKTCHWYWFKNGNLIEEK